MSSLLETKLNSIKTKETDKPQSNLRVWGVFFFGFILISIIGVRLWFLQINFYDFYKQKSENNRLRIVPVSANRGIIYDRNGKVLVGNKISYSALIYPVKLTDEVKEKVNFLANILEIKPEKILYKINLAGEYSPYPIEIKHQINQKTIAKLLENKPYLPAITIEKNVTRTHKHNNNASHILGYTGEISNKQYLKLKDKGYKIGNIIGKTGIEYVFENDLKGKVGGRYIEVDSIGRERKELQIEKPKQGNSVYLTIDLKLQKEVEKILTGYNGAAVVMDVNTGEVLAMASKPDFDPNMFYDGISTKDWKAIQKLKYPFYNRAIGAFPPGSVFKIVSSIAAMELKKANSKTRFFSKGYYDIAGHRFWDWNPNGFGWVNMEKALAFSIDTVYYELANEIGMDRLKNYANMFGLGTKTGISLNSESKGIIPDRHWKKKYLKQDWYAGDSINASIGQGFVTATPLQVNVMTSIIANNGSLLVPKIVKKIEAENGTVIKSFKPEVKANYTFSKSSTETVKKGLRAVVTYGTSKVLQFKDVAIAAKTGSAEDPPRKKTHAWITSYAPFDKPKYAVTVFLQNAGHGGEFAGPLARKIYMELFNIKN